MHTPAIPERAPWGVLTWDRTNPPLTTSQPKSPFFYVSFKNNTAPLRAALNLEWIAVMFDFHKLFGSDFYFCLVKII